MSKQKGRIAQDEVLGIVEQAIALERQRIEIMPDAQIDEVGGGAVIDVKIDTSTTMGFFPTEPDIFGA